MKITTPASRKTVEELKRSHEERRARAYEQLRQSKKIRGYKVKKH